MVATSSRLVSLVALMLIGCGGDEDALFNVADGSLRTIDGRAGPVDNAGAAGQAGSAGAASGSGGGTSEAGAQGADSAADPLPDASAGGSGGEPGMDAAAGSMAVDAGPDACTPRMTFHADADDDGYGSTAGPQLVACSHPLNGHWVLIAGDCNDKDSRVHPGQAAYFGAPYRAPSGADSYDYDCSGSEEEDGSQAKAPMNCGLLSLTLCGGTGYTPTARVGQGLSAFCGSNETSSCRAAVGILVCESVKAPAAEPFRCK